MMDDLPEDDTFVQYTEDGELVFQVYEEETDVSLKVTDVLADTEEITSDSDWSDQVSPQRERVWHHLTGRSIQVKTRPVLLVVASSGERN